MQDISSYSDQALFAAIAKDDEAAFCELFHRYDKRIYFFALKMIKNEIQAEEITQEIFIRLWNKRGTLSLVVNPEAYLLTIAARSTLNAIKKLLRDRKMREKLAINLKETFHNDTEQLLFLHDSEALVQEAIDKLPAQQKKVYQFSRRDGLSYEEIAAQLGISRNTVRNHLVEALRTIRLYLEDQGEILVALVVCLGLFR